MQSIEASETNKLFFPSKKIAVAQGIASGMVVGGGLMFLGLREGGGVGLTFPMAILSFIKLVDIREEMYEQALMKQLQSKGHSSCTIGKQLYCVGEKKLIPVSMRSEIKNFKRPGRQLGSVLAPCPLIKQDLYKTDAFATSMLAAGLASFAAVVAWKLLNPE